MSLPEAMAHEVQNLLLAIARATGVLLGRKDLENSARRDVEQIRVATERADQLTRGLLEFARQPAEPVPVEVNTLVCRIKPMLDRLVGGNVDLSLRLARALGPIRIDPIQLEQALLNLVLNARDAIPDQGEVEISTKRVVIPEAAGAPLPPGAYVALSVHDNGKGIDDESVDLSFVRALVAESGGETRVTSRRGIGTTVELRLPELGPNGSG